MRYGSGNQMNLAEISPRDLSVVSGIFGRVWKPNLDHNVFGVTRICRRLAR